MASDQYMDICERIRKRCQQRRWYGPESKHGQIPTSGYYDAQGTWHEPASDVFDYRGFIDEVGKLQVRAITHDPRISFEYTPATKEELQFTEECLDIPLLPMLRTLYAQVANGGFGPACGITGVYGGYSFGDDGRYQTLDMFADTHPFVEYINLTAHENHHGDQHKTELPLNVWPAHFLHFCYYGCGEDVFVDGKSSRVYLVEAGQPQQEGYTILINRLDNSLENWLERWLRDEFIKKSRKNRVDQVNHLYRR